MLSAAGNCVSLVCNSTQHIKGESQHRSVKWKNHENGKRLNLKLLGDRNLNMTAFTFQELRTFEWFSFEDQIHSLDEEKRRQSNLLLCKTHTSSTIWVTFSFNLLWRAEKLCLLSASFLTHTKLLHSTQFCFHPSRCGIKRRKTFLQAHVAENSSL